MSMVPVEVVCALIQKDNRYLVGLRPQGTSNSGFWEFPGGKIEKGETPEQALVRELDEELGLKNIQVQELFLRQTHHFSSGKICLSAYSVAQLTEEPQRLWHDRIYWAPVPTLEQLPLLPSNTAIIHKLSRVAL